MRPEDTQKIVIGSSGMSKMLLTLLGVIATILAYVGTSVISKVDMLTTTFSTYTVVMERRVTMLEESQRSQDAQIREALDRGKAK